MDQLGLRLPTIRKVQQELTSTFIQKSHLRFVQSIGNIDSESSKVSERRTRMTQTRLGGEKPKLEVVTGPRSEVECEDRVKDSREWGEEKVSLSKELR